MDNLYDSQFGTQASRDSIDVQKHILDVLAAAESQEEPVASTSGRGTTPTQAQGAAHAQRPASSSRAPRSRQPSYVGSGGQQGAGSSSVLPDRPPSASGGTNAAGGSSSINLDVPGHAEASLRLHKARIRALEGDLERMVESTTDKDKQLAEALKELKGLKGEQSLWAKDKKNLETQVDRLQKRLADTEATLAAREQALKEGSKETSRVGKERRVAEQESKARDVRLQRALEEVERYKNMLQEVRLQDRDGKDLVKGDLNRLMADNKRLERQRAELLVAFKKQLKLIDVLKRQKVHMEAARALQFTEAEFLQTLELGNA
ncbi:hypothetical protein DUNSADRAFT_12092 [Dunaliella salina]|uniref:Testis-expressed sequence 9 protein n=1 Tax=Dunaliella salina TaxID=3046 RepID=A0ABQ7H491_DUNSA|nr:hypothetical protein DUNSADRAFT_12092 [Dunaliella salina]|eukprot:KAF5841636.1 hypothetical protein DUNSADRAFT_12092 [Dunaliella salina]